MNELSAPERKTILGLLRLGWSIRRVARETGRRHETIRRYGQDAGLLPAPPATSKPHTPNKVPTDLEQTPSPPTTAIANATSRSSVRGHTAFIEDELAKGRNAVPIYQDLVEHHGYSGSYDAVKRFARRTRPAEPKVSCRFETAPGEEAQVDYGEGAPTRNPRTGKYGRPRLFVMTLSKGRLVPRSRQAPVQLVYIEFLTSHYAPEASEDRGRNRGHVSDSRGRSAWLDARYPLRSH